MSAAFFLGWAGVLGFLAVLALTSRPGRGATSLLPQLAVVTAVLLVGGIAFHRAARPERPSLEAWSVHIGAGATPATLGTDPSCDVVLQDDHGAPVHAQVAFTEAGPLLSSLSTARRLERNGVDIHHPVLEPGSRILLDDSTWTVRHAGGLLPSIVLESDAGEELRLRPGPLRRLACALPLIGPRFEVSVARIDDTLDRPLRRREANRVTATGPVAEIALRGRTPLLRFPTASDRHAHRVRVAVPDGDPRRPADTPALLEAGDELTIGYTRYGVGITADGSLDLTVLGVPPRRPFDPTASLLSIGPASDLPWSTGTAPVLLQVTADDDVERLVLTSTDPAWALSDRKGYVWLHPRGSGIAEKESMTMDRGSGLVLSGPRHGAVFRYRVPTGAAGLLGGQEPGTPEARLVRSLVAAAVLYLALTLLLAWRGVLHGGNAAVFHGAAVLLAVGLPLLAELSPAGDPQRAGIVLRQASYLVIGLSAATALAAVAALATALRPRHRRIRSLLLLLEEPISAGRGGMGSFSRIWLLWLAAALTLVVQLPFGERGIPLPIIGSLQPIEAAKTLLLLFVAFLSVRAMEDKRFRLTSSERLRHRWTYMLHGVPILVIAGLCFGLADISPILLLGLFLWAMYLLSLRQPSRRFWPPSEWPHNIYIEQIVLAGLVIGALALLAATGEGTVAERFRAWNDPWRFTATSGQFVSSLWMILDGGLVGRGFGAPMTGLTPAAHDDFVLAALANRTGLLGVALTVLTYGLILTAGLRAASAVGAQGRRAAVAERAQMLAIAALLMLAIQVGVVLASVSGWAPVMGQPLPFLAAGGSHLLLFCFPAVALVLAATRRIPQGATP